MVQQEKGKKETERQGQDEMQAWKDERPDCQDWIFCLIRMWQEAQPPQPDLQFTQMCVYKNWQSQNWLE